MKKTNELAAQLIEIQDILDPTLTDPVLSYGARSRIMAARSRIAAILSALDPH
jgi:hypothetical protein